MTKLFIDGQWLDDVYQDLHDDYGMTLTPSVPVSYLDGERHVVDGWENNGETWIIGDAAWYADPPYWKHTDRTASRYRIDVLETFDIYVKQASDYVWHEGEFWSLADLHELFGYTETPSSVWDMDEGTAWAWYNGDIELYWDDRSGKKTWTSSPPTPMPPGPEPPEPQPDFSGQGMTGTYRVWGDVSDAGVHFGEWSFGTAMPGMIAIATVQYAQNLNHFDGFVLPGVMSNS